MLKVQNIDVYYGNIQALKGLSLEVNEGEIVTLIGANGAGKSTLLKTLSGLLKPKGGIIEYEGFSIAGKAAQTIVKSGISHVPGSSCFCQYVSRRKLRAWCLST